MKKTRREMIIEEAQILFKNKGFSATTMRDLAERVGVEAASLYKIGRASCRERVCLAV